tara:strand:+ start:59 stop:553 length:495 start_codon:yes stop_codon:yes gene_type:complete
MRTPFWPTLDIHAQVGLSYDMSIAFNESPGYRLGIGFPFYPWDPRHERIIPVMQIPTVLMDGALLYDPDQTIDGALSEIDIILNNVKKHSATVAIDWHVRSSYPGNRKYAKWATVYAELLKRLELDPEIEVTTPDALKRSWINKGSSSRRETQHSSGMLDGIST